ncbi:MAG: low molecular weight protein-tyrosine-phosphatase [Caldilineaceae bacterium]
MTISILFVCMGNVCRSPMAEALMRQMVAQAGLDDQIVVDSAGTGDWHVGEPPHRGTRRVLADHGVRTDGMAARMIGPGDLHHFDYLIVMDGANLREVQRLAKHYGRRGVIARLLDYADPAIVGGVRDVPDPYYDGRFGYVYDLVAAGCAGLLAALQRDHALSRAAHDEDED